MVHKFRNNGIIIPTIIIPGDHNKDAPDQFYDSERIDSLKKTFGIKDLFNKKLILI